MLRLGPGSNTDVCCVYVHVLALSVAMVVHAYALDPSMALFDETELGRFDAATPPPSAPRGW